MHATTHTTHTHTLQTIETTEVSPLHTLNSSPLDTPRQHARLSPRRRSEAPHCAAHNEIPMDTTASRPRRSRARTPPTQQQCTPRCPSPSPGKPATAHAAVSAPGAHPRSQRPEESLQCRPRRGRAHTLVALPRAHPNAPATARPGPAHAAAPAVAWARPATHSPAPKSMARQ
jgi:hypothetical protein